MRASFAVGKHATMATIRADGAPRISGTEVEFGDDGEVYLGMAMSARRAADLRRDPRVAIHAPSNDPPEGRPAAWPGEGKVAGRAIAVPPERFRIDITEVVLTRVAADESCLEITFWRPEAGVRTIRRA